jgi:hypothetical protein
MAKLLTLKKHRAPLEPKAVGMFAVIERRPEGHTMRFTKFHHSKESAATEAARLQCNGKEFLVMEVVESIRREV